MICKTKNLGQSANNMFKIPANDSGCCGETWAPCRRTFTLATTENAVTMTLTEDGVDRVISLPSAITTNDATILRQEISKALIDAGYIECKSDLFRGVEVTIASTVVTVVITGDVVVKNIIYSDGTVNPTVACTQVNRCTFTAAEVGALTTPTLRVNGTDKTLISIVPGTTTTNQIKTSVETALTSPTVAGTVTVTSEGTGTDMLYTITISASNADNSFILAGERLARTGCAATFTT